MPSIVDNVKVKFILRCEGNWDVGKEVSYIFDKTIDKTVFKIFFKISLKNIAIPLEIIDIHIDSFGLLLII